MGVILSETLNKLILDVLRTREEEGSYFQAELYLWV